MLWFRYALLILGMAALSGGCAPYKPETRPSILKSSDSTGKSNILSRGGSLTDIVLVSKLMAGQESNFKAVAKMGGFTTPKTQIVYADQGAKFQAIGLPVNKADLLTIEIYEGETLKFIAKKASTQLVTNNSAPVQIEECQMLAAPWDGVKSEGGCNWEIEEVK